MDNKKLKAYRLAKGLSLTEFSRKVGVTKSMLSKIENGKRNISRKILYKIFGYSVYTCSKCGGSHEGTYEDFMDQLCA